MYTRFLHILSPRHRSRSWQFLLAEPGQARDYLGARPDTPQEEDEELHHQPEDLSCPRPEEEVKTEETGLFRPYCLKDPVEYKYERPVYPSFPSYTPHPAFIQYRNIEDLATAQAILDLSQPRGPSPPLSLPANQSDVKTEPSPDTDQNAAVFKINNGRTTAYTYEVSN